MQFSVLISPLYLMADSERKKPNKTNKQKTIKNSVTIKIKLYSNLQIPADRFSSHHFLFP